MGIDEEASIPIKPIKIKGHPRQNLSVSRVTDQLYVPKIQDHSSRRLRILRGRIAFAPKKYRIKQRYINRQP